MIPVIVVEQLTKKFGDFTAVDALSFSVYHNEIFGLLGPNGAGKTTTISMICGLLPPTGGSIEFTGQAKKNPKLLIGYCPQENIYYPKLTCLEQLIFIGRMYGMPAALAQSRSVELLELLGLSDKRNSIASKLSGGMKRRLNICLALVHNPEILILDEPEAGLDPQSRILVREFIKSFGRQKTVILTTHNMDEADRLVHRVAIMDYGRFLLLDTPDRLKKSIGEGDRVEIIAEKDDEKLINDFTAQASLLAEMISRNSNHMVFRHHDLFKVLPELKKLATNSGLGISEFKLRQNTLEDVFIQLTGRNLRQ